MKDRINASFSFEDLGNGVSKFEGYAADEYHCYVFSRSSAMLAVRPWKEGEKHKVSRPYKCGIIFGNGEEIGLDAEDIFCAAARHLGWSDPVSPDSRAAELRSLKEL